MTSKNAPTAGVMLGWGHYLHSRLTLSQAGDRVPERWR
jgi:hypothetical protein